MSDTFFFLIHPASDKSTVTVADLSHERGYERGDFCCVDSTDYNELTNALKAAKDYAWRNRLIYQPFSSRYDSSTSEPDCDCNVGAVLATIGCAPVSPQRDALLTLLTGHRDSLKAAIDTEATMYHLNESRHRDWIRQVLKYFEPVKGPSAGTAAWLLWSDIEQSGNEL